MLALLRLLSEQPMPPDDSDFGLKIDFRKGQGDPRRIFDAASVLIDAFEILDDAFGGFNRQQDRTPYGSRGCRSVVAENLA
jgi:hypothetical protein